MMWTCQSGRIVFCSAKKWNDFICGWFRGGGGGGGGGWGGGL